MSRAIRKQIIDLLGTLKKANQLADKLMKNRDKANIVPLLEECQNCAIQIGNQIDKIWGDEGTCISILEDYCETIYQLSISIEDIRQWDENYRRSRRQLENFEEALAKEIPDKIEVVFMPYKASMWDSLESIWMAADADPQCDAYVVPISYYDRNADGTLEKYHYEGNDFPEYVPIIHYDDYLIAERRPDAVYIHNPYDQGNHVTSVDPRFYSSEIKKYTEQLIYVPYYATSGGMSEGQALCQAYFTVDYIVVQAEKYKQFFHPMIPREKLVALGSPKFDRIIRMCQNPPEPPTEWKAKMEGKKVYFYNTSINGMLGNTQSFLMKMEYVFKCFAGRNDACLVWRPHPLLESTFISMRAVYKPIYDALKKYYLESGFGIYDDTPDMTRTIALCDAYIGDAGTSVTSLFGIAGKPVFVLNNNISSKPEADDWRGEIVKGFYAYGNDEWMVTQGNKLYRAKVRDYKYEYFCDLCDYAYGNYYAWVLKVNGKDYVCPANAQNILQIGEAGIEKRIELKRCIERQGAFYGAVSCGRYLFLIPNNYPAIVRYDTVTGKVEYYTDHLDVFIGNVEGQKRLGGFCVWKDYVYIASPVDNRVLAIHAETGKMQVMTIGAQNSCGCFNMIADKNELWLLPYFGKVITKWNPESGEVYEYDNCPEGLMCKHPILGYECEEVPFGFAAISEDYVYLPPYWGNMYVLLDKRTGKMTEWKAGCTGLKDAPSGYYTISGHAYFAGPVDESNEDMQCLFSLQNRKLYKVNLRTNETWEISVEFEPDELKMYEPGFAESSEWLKYACQENAFNTLSDFLDGAITGGKFDSEKQIQAYGEIAANYDGTCGDKVHEFIRGKLFYQ